MIKFSDILAAFEGKLSVFKKHPPILTGDDFGEFLATRASFIAQKTLYGYLKTRMGMQFPKMFEDDVFIESINIAKWNLYAACISDLAIYMAANFYSEQSDKKPAQKMADFWFHHVIDDRFENGEFKGSTKVFKKEFKERLKDIDWDEASIGEGAFKASPDALIKWAPIDQTLKSFDEPVVRNSIRFQWQAIRREFNKLLDREALRQDLKLAS